MSESDGREDQAQPEKKFSQEHYARLMRCAEEGKIEEWNEWRKSDPFGTVPLLEGADLTQARLQKADLFLAHLEGANLSAAQLEEAVLQGAHLERAMLYGTCLETAMLFKAHLKAATLTRTRLEGANLVQADLQMAELVETHLEGANLAEADLQGTLMQGTYLQGAHFPMALVDGRTVLQYCQIDRATDFTAVGLASARVDPGLKQLLEYNIRRIRWRKWYGEGPRWQRPFRLLLVQPFWLVSDYGRSSWRIMVAFGALSVLFAAIYWCWPAMLTLSSGEGQVRGFFHALYFSVVTMTTLGFGDIHADPDSLCGQMLLMFQVILGYGLLGALVTRLSILFQTGGPSASFSPRRRE